MTNMQVVYVTVLSVYLFRTDRNQVVDSVSVDRSKVEEIIYCCS